MLMIATITCNHRVLCLPTQCAYCCQNTILNLFLVLLHLSLCALTLLIFILQLALTLPMQAVARSDKLNLQYMQKRYADGHVHVLDHMAAQLAYHHLDDLSDAVQTVNAAVQKHKAETSSLCHGLLKSF